MALALGALFGALAIEVAVRVLWGGIVKPHERPLIDGTPLGEALYAESLGTYVETVSLIRLDLYRPDATRGFTLRPEVSIRLDVVDGAPGETFLVRTDEHGLRGAPRSPPPAGAARVLVVGDSMTFGKGVDDDATFPALLERRLERELGRPARVWNAGVVSMGPVEELATVEQLVPRLRPDLVLWQFTVANDPCDVLRWREDEAGRALVADLESGRSLADDPWLTNPLAWGSRAYRLLAWRYGRHAVKYRDMLRPDRLDRCARLIVRARDAARAHGARFGVLIAPTVAQVEGTWEETALRWLGVATPGINAGMRERLEREGIEVLDPLEAMRAARAQGGDLYIPIDRHWTRRGNEVVAGALAPFARDLLPRR